MSRFLNKKLFMSTIAAIIATAGVGFSGNCGVTSADEPVVAKTAVENAMVKNAMVSNAKSGKVADGNREGEVVESETEVKKINKEAGEKGEERSEPARLKDAKVNVEDSNENGEKSTKPALKTDDKKDEDDKNSEAVSKTDDKKDEDDKNSEAVSKTDDKKDEDEETGVDVAIDKQVSSEELERINVLKADVGKIKQEIGKIRQEVMLSEKDCFAKLAKVLSNASFMLVENPEFANFFEGDTFVIEKMRLGENFNLLSMGALAKSDANLPENLVLEIIADPEIADEGAQIGKSKKDETIFESPVDVINPAKMIFSDAEKVDAEIYKMYDRPMFFVSALCLDDLLENNKSYIMKLIDGKGKNVLATLKLKTEFKSLLDELDKVFSDEVAKLENKEAVKLLQENEVPVSDGAQVGVN